MYSHFNISEIIMCPTIKGTLQLQLEAYFSLLVIHKIMLYLSISDTIDLKNNKYANIIRSNFTECYNIHFFHNEFLLYVHLEQRQF